MTQKCDQSTADMFSPAHRIIGCLLALLQQGKIKY